MKKLFIISGIFVSFTAVAMYAGQPVTSNGKAQTLSAYNVAGNDTTPKKGDTTSKKKDTMSLAYNTMSIDTMPKKTDTSSKKKDTTAFQLLAKN